MIQCPRHPRSSPITYDLLSMCGFGRGTLARRGGAMPRGTGRERGAMTGSIGEPGGLPQLEGTTLVTDYGLETDPMFHHAAGLPGFAAFVLLRDERGRALLEGYYREHL